MLERLRYRLGARLLEPLVREMQLVYRKAPNEKPVMPPVGGPDFKAQQTWHRDIAAYNSLEAFKRHALLTIGNVIGLGRRWPLPGWEKQLLDSIDHFRSDVLPWNVTWDPGGLDRHAERIHGLKQRNQGLEDVLTRLYQHSIDDMPEELAADIEANLGWKRTTHLSRPVSSGDEGWGPTDG